VTNGSTIGSLHLLRRIGAGGMGEVWLARDEALGVDRAVKLLLPERAGDAALRARFAAEARTLAALGDVPGVVRVHAAGEDPATRRPFFVMDAHLLAPDEVRAVCTRRLGLPAAAAEAISHAVFAESKSHAERAEDAESKSHAELAESAESKSHAESAEDAESKSHAESAEDAESKSHAERAEDAERSFTLQDALGDEAAGTARQIPERAVLSLAREIAAALARLHGRAPPVVHRDLKPSNLLFAADGRLLLADFGVAKTLESAQTGLTRTGAQPGTQRYAAPELLRGDPATPAADWYALGVVLFRALTSSFPQWGEAFPTREGMRPFSPLWEPIVRDLLASDPVRRLADRAAFSRRLDALEKALDTRKWPARRAKEIALAAAVVAVGAASFLFRQAENGGDVSYGKFEEEETHAERAEVPVAGEGSGEAVPPPVAAHAADRGMTMSDVYSEARFPRQPSRHGRVVSGMPSELDTSRYADGPGPPPQEVDPAPIREFLPDLERKVETAINNLVSPWNKRSDYAVAEMQYRESYARQMLKSAESFRKRAEAGETIPDIDFFNAHFSREHWEAWLARRRAEESAARKIPPASPESGTKDPLP